MTLKERYYGKNPHGTMHYTNTMGIVVWFPDDNDKFDCDIVSANWCLDHGYSNFRKHKINSFDECIVKFKRFLNTGEVAF